MTTIYSFDQCPDRRVSDSVKWNTYEQDVLPAWVADMDFVSPEPIIRALQARVEHGVFGYPCDIPGSSKEIPELRQVIVERMARRYGWRVHPEEILFTPGVVIAFNLACHAFASSTEAVLVQTPVYQPILKAAINTGIMGQEMAMTGLPDGSYEVDWEAFEASITPETRLFILCNPHNPVGKVFRQDELQRIAEICMRHHITICSDEIHCDLIYPGHRHIPIASLDLEIAKHTITLIAPSKTFNIPGLQCSIAIIQNRELRKQFLNARKGLVPWVNLMGLVAAHAAYTEGQEWLDQLLVYLEANRDFLFNYVNQYLPGITMGKPQGTYLAWLDCRQAMIEGSAYRFFLEKGRVALNDGGSFGRGGEGHVRLNFGCPRSRLEDVLNRMRKTLG